MPIGFLEFYPTKPVQLLKTTQEKHLQLVQELEILEFSNPDKEISIYIKQGCQLFLDAWKSNYTSSPLLYYYSFLNLVKGYLIFSGEYSKSQLEEDKSYHGLKTTPQKLKSIIDFTFTIHPNGKGGLNIFPKFYELFTGVPWPFQENITINLRDIIPYCPEISSEAFRLYEIKPQCEEVQSLLLYSNHEVWIEFLVSEWNKNNFVKILKKENISNFPAKSLSTAEKQMWLFSMSRNAYNLLNFECVRSPFNNFTNNEEKISLVNKIKDNFSQRLKGCGFNTPYFNPNFKSWLFINPIKIENQDVHWHPILSNYIFSYVLSNLFRYYPHLLEKDETGLFITKAWNSQAPVNFLGYLVMEMTDPQVRIERIS